MSIDEDPIQYSKAQQFVLIFLPVLTGSLSLVGSTCIVRDIWQRRRRRRRRRLGREGQATNASGNAGPVYYRILLATSLVDMFVSTGIVVLSPWAVPRQADDPVIQFGNFASTSSCNAMAMVLHLTQIEGAYAAFLSLYFVLIIRYQVREEWMAQWMEPWFHGVALLVPTVSGILAWRRQLFNPLMGTPGWCYLSDYPNECHRHDTVECERGEDYLSFSRTVVLSAFGLGLGLVLVDFLLLAWTVHTQVTRMQRYAAASSTDHKLRQQVWCRAFCYIGVFVVTFLPAVLVTVINREEEPENGRYYYAIGFSNKFLLPLQGFWTCIIYFRLGGGATDTTSASSQQSMSSLRLPRGGSKLTMVEVDSFGKSGTVGVQGSTEAALPEHDEVANNA